MRIQSSDPDFIKEILRQLTNHRSLLVENQELEKRNDKLNLKIVELVQEVELLKECLKAYKESLEIMLSRA